MSKHHVADRGERRPLAGDLCTCGRPAILVFTGGQWGDTGWCGLESVPQLRPCAFCGEDVDHEGRCPRYAVNPSARDRLGPGLPL